MTIIQATVQRTPAGQRNRGTADRGQSEEGGTTTGRNAYRIIIL